MESLLINEQKQSVTHLTITGTLQVVDYAYLCNDLIKKLVELNLRDADIDTIPAHAFDYVCDGNAGPKKRIVLPVTLKHLSDYSLYVNGSSHTFILTGSFPSLGRSVYSHEGHDRWCIMELASDNTLYKMEDDAIYSLDGSVL